MQPESMDAFSYQEVILPGQILAAVLKDALFNALIKLRTQYMVVRSATEEFFSSHGITNCRIVMLGVSYASLRRFTALGYWMPLVSWLYLSGTTPS